MNGLAPPIERVINELSKLPSIGRKTAQRLAFHLLRAEPSEARALAEAIVEMRDEIGECRDCFNLAAAELCPICADPGREPGTLCVVADAGDLLALEKTGAFRGRYHVLGGVLSPLRDIGPDDLHLGRLLERVRDAEFREVILATDPDVEGEATAVYISRLLKPLGIAVSRLAQGLAVGGDLEFTDDLTLRRAFEGRREY